VASETFRHLEGQEHLRGAFGNDAFGRAAEHGARFFGTPQYIVGQSLVVVAWVVLNALALSLRWDPYPFILLNLAFSTQAAYAAPLILLAQTRQAARDQAHSEAVANHMEELAEEHRRLLGENTRLTEQIHRLTAEIHEHLYDSAS
jgi:uncharacterized membrane protein